MVTSELINLSADFNRPTWVVLRCASADTFKLVESLVKFGIAAWSPTGYKRGRKPRSRSYYDKVYPLVSTYVFASAIDLLDLKRLADRPAKDMPVFTVFHHCGGVPEIADRQLDALRYEEERLKAIYLRQLAKARRKTKFKIDYRVKFNEGAFAGLSGKVVEHKGAFALVSIDGFELPIRVAEALIEDC
jgi:hypothetical protein